jgi:hypothetical protein
MANTNMPKCIHCFGTGWTKVTVLGKTELNLWQCGHGPAGAEEMKNGCSRIIAATDDQMSTGGII